MDIQALQEQMRSYAHWRQNLERRLERFDQWVQDHGLASREVRACLQGARTLLQGEGFTLACVGEFSRGKTELINALLAGPGEQRILPSQPGRTTMCPTEIHCDAEGSNCVRLLPIETRRAATSLQSFRRIPQKWINLPLNPEDPKQLREALQQASASRWVAIEEAEQLGFSIDELGERNAEGLVAIPRWRHAMISLDHPLLRQGLRIIDTPGLNALGNEPELTLKILPQAQAIVFVLAADSGVSASDMAIWRNHIQGLSENHGVAVLALLNKIDSLWDDLQSEQQVDSAIEELSQLSAYQLQLPADQVLPISAKQALLGRVHQRPEQLKRSGFAELEQALAGSVERSRQQLAKHRLLVDSQAMILDLNNSLKRRLEESEQELALVRAGDREDNSELLQELREAIRNNHRHYHKQALSLRTSQMLLEKQRTGLLAPISMAGLEQMIAETRADLAQSWTSVGLSRGIGSFFDQLDTQMQHLDRELERANKVLTSIYQRPEHGQDLPLEEHKLNLVAERRQLKQLHQQADQFRASLNNLLSLKGVLIQRFIGTLVQEVRDIWETFNKAVETWLSQALAPLFHHNQYQKQMLEHHMLRLTRMRTQQQSYTEQLHSLRGNVEQLQLALEQLQPLYLEITAPTEPKSKGAEVVSLELARRALTAN